MKGVSDTLHPLAHPSKLDYPGIQYMNHAQYTKNDTNSSIQTTSTLKKSEILQKQMDSYIVSIINQPPSTCDLFEINMNTSNSLTTYYGPSDQHQGYPVIPVHYRGIQGYQAAEWQPHHATIQLFGPRVVQNYDSYDHVNHTRKTIKGSLIFNVSTPSMMISHNSHNHSVHIYEASKFLFCLIAFESLDGQPCWLHFLWSPIQGPQHMGWGTFSDKARVDLVVIKSIWNYIQSNHATLMKHFWHRSTPKELMNVVKYCPDFALFLVTYCDTTIDPKWRIKELLCEFDSNDFIELIKINSDILRDVFSLLGNQLSTILTSNQLDDLREFFQHDHQLLYNLNLIDWFKEPSDYKKRCQQEIIYRNPIEYLSKQIRIDESVHQLYEIRTGIPDWTQLDKLDFGEEITKENAARILEKIRHKPYDNFSLVLFCAILKSKTDTWHQLDYGKTKKTLEKNICIGELVLDYPGLALIDGVHITYLYNHHLRIRNLFYHHPEIAERYIKQQ